MGSFSIWHWLVVLLVVILVFGTKKLRNIGQDLGGAVKGFKEGLRDGDAPQNAPNATNTPHASNAPTANGRTFDAEPHDKG